MPTVTLTAAFVSKTKPPQTGRREYWDELLPGFGMRITDSGARSWVFMYRIAGQKRRLTIGSANEIGLAEARQRARKSALIVAEGRDPGLERVEAESEALQRRETTYEATVKDYVEQVCRGRKKNRTAGRIEAILLKYPAAWKSRPVKSLTRADVNALLQGLAKKHPAMALYVYANLTAFFNWCVGLQIISVMPIHKSLKPSQPKVRNRPLTPEEIRAVWIAALHMGYPYGDIVRLALLTGQRREEVAALTWDELDLHKREWYLPAERAKAKRAHTIPLSPAAVELLVALPHFADGPFIFTTTHGRASYTGYSKSWERLKKSAKLTDADLKFKDFRETVATMMRSKLGIGIQTISECLNHAPASVTTKHYAAEHDLKGKRSAFEAWAMELNRIVTGKSDATVVAFPGGRR